MPDEAIEVRAAGESVILSGRVSSAVRLDRALDVAERYAPEKVTNLLSVTGSQQVMLAVRFAEVQRRVVKELGLNSQVSGGDFVVSVGDALLNGFFSATAIATRSEEHTSELQSLMRISYAVFCLKKKTTE